MVSESELREYAINIYKRVEGYTFEKVQELFPRYYTSIVSYYMELVMEEQQTRIKNVTITGYTALFLFKRAQQQWNQIVEEDKKLRRETDITGFDEKVFAQWQRQIDFSKVVIKAAQQVKLYGEGILDNQVINAADETIKQHQKVIEQTQSILKFFKELTNGK